MEHTESLVSGTTGHFFITKGPSTYVQRTWFEFLNHTIHFVPDNFWWCIFTKYTRALLWTRRSNTGLCGLSPAVQRTESRLWLGQGNNDMSKMAVFFEDRRKPFTSVLRVVRVTLRTKFEVKVNVDPSWIRELYRTRSYQTAESFIQLPIYE